MITYPMIRRAVEKTTQMRRHVRQIAQGIKPSEYTEFDQKLAKSIEEESGKYSKNPIKKITSWVKEFVIHIKDERNWLKNNPPQKPIENIKEGYEALDKAAFQMPLAARDAHFITKDLDTDVASNMGRRLKEQLHQEQGFGTWKK